MFKYVTLLVIAMLTACTPSTNEIKESFVLPKELSHCKMYAMRGGVGQVVYVVHCPNSTTTTYTGGKASDNITIVDQGELL